MWSKLYCRYATLPQNQALKLQHSTDTANWSTNWKLYSDWKFECSGEILCSPGVLIALWLHILKKGKYLKVLVVKILTEKFVFPCLPAPPPFSRPPPEIHSWHLKTTLTLISMFEVIHFTETQNWTTEDTSWMCWGSVLLALKFILLIFILRFDG